MSKLVSRTVDGLARSDRKSTAASSGQAPMLAIKDKPAAGHTAKKEALSQRESRAKDARARYAK